MKNFFIFSLIFINSWTGFSQKMMTRNGEIKFEASTVEAFEEIAAVNNSVSCIFDQSTGDFVVLALVKAFKFKAPLMEEHFNENYIESSKFPKANFKGKVLNFDASKLLATKSTFDLEGDLTLHGITKKVKTKISLAVIAGKVTSIANFSIKPTDYGIEIPSIVKNKIAQNAKLTINFVLEEKK